MEKGVVIEDVDRRSTWTVVPVPCYSQANKYSRRTKRTYAVETRRILHPCRFFRWIDEGRQLISRDSCRGSAVVDVVGDRRWLASCNPRVTLMGTEPRRLPRVWEVWSMIERSGV